MTLLFLFICLLIGPLAAGKSISHSRQSSSNVDFGPDVHVFDERLERRLDFGLEEVDDLLGGAADEGVGIHDLVEFAEDRSEEGIGFDS